MKEGFTQAKEAQKKENPKKDDPAQKSEQSKVMDSTELENQKLAAEKTYRDQSDYQSDQKCGEHLRKTSEKRTGTGFRDSQEKSERSHRHPRGLSF